MNYFVDIDDTICYCDSLEDYPHGAKPIAENIDKINKLYDQGHTIVYWTARGGAHGDASLKFKLTLEQLNEWGCKFHELRMGKPSYDVLICDKTKRIEEL